MNKLTPNDPPTIFDFDEQDATPLNAPKAVKTSSTPYDSFIEDSARRHGVDPDLIRAQMSQESSFKKNATSNKGARGLMQLMPATAARFGVTDIYDPRQNIEGGVKYMRFLLDKFGGNVDLALAGYNAGEGAVMKYGNNIPPYAETQNYVKRIRANYGGSGQGKSAGNDYSIWDDSNFQNNFQASNAYDVFNEAQDEPAVAPAPPVENVSVSSADPRITETENYKKNVQSELLRAKTPARREILQRRLIEADERLRLLTAPNAPTTPASDAAPQFKGSDTIAETVMPEADASAANLEKILPELEAKLKSATRATEKVRLRRQIKDLSKTLDELRERRTDKFGVPENPTFPVNPAPVNSAPFLSSSASKDSAGGDTENDNFTGNAKKLLSGIEQSLQAHLDRATDTDEKKRVAEQLAFVRQKSGEVFDPTPQPKATEADYDEYLKYVAGTGEKPLSKDEFFAKANEATGFSSSAGYQKDFYTDEGLQDKTRFERESAEYNRKIGERNRAINATNEYNARYGNQSSQQTPVQSEEKGVSENKAVINNEPQSGRVTQSYISPEARASAEEQFQKANAYTKPLTYQFSTVPTDSDLTRASVVQSYGASAFDADRAYRELTGKSLFKTADNSADYSAYFTKENNFTAEVPTVIYPNTQRLVEAFNQGGKKGLETALAMQNRMAMSDVAGEEEAAAEQRLRESAQTSSRNQDGTANLLDANNWKLAIEKILENPSGLLRPDKIEVTEEERRAAIDKAVDEMIANTGSAKERERLDREYEQLSVLEKGIHHVGDFAATIARFPAAFARTGAWLEDVTGYLREKTFFPTLTTTDVLNAVDWVYAKSLGYEAKTYEQGKLPMLLSDAIEKAIPDDPLTANTLSGKLARGLGSAVPFLIGAIASGGSTPVIALLGIGSQAGDLYKQAKDAGLSREKQLLAGLAGVPVGASEVLGLKWAKLGELINSKSKGLFLESFTKFLYETGKEATEETLQEYFQNVASDLTVKALKQNGVSRKDIADALGDNVENGLIAGLTGAIFGGGSHVAQGAAYKLTGGFGENETLPALESVADNTLTANIAKTDSISETPQVSAESRPSVAVGDTVETPQGTGVVTREIGKKNEAVAVEIEKDGKRRVIQVNKKKVNVINDENKTQPQVSQSPASEKPSDVVLPETSQSDVQPNVEAVSPKTEKSSKAAPEIVSHPDPNIDGKPIVAETSDGKVIVPNPANKSGVSVVTNGIEQTQGLTFDSSRYADEAAAKPIKEESLPETAKEPYQMTRESYSQAEQKFIQERLPQVSAETLVTKDGNSWIVKTIKGEEFQGTYKTRKDALKQAQGHLDLQKNLLRNFEGYNSHKEIVEKALSEGKTVPPEVLKDYPDLAEKYGKNNLEQSRIQPSEQSEQSEQSGEITDEQPGVRVKTEGLAQSKEPYQMTLDELKNSGLVKTYVKRTSREEKYPKKIYNYQDFRAEETDGNKDFHDIHSQIVLDGLIKGKKVPAEVEREARENSPELFKHFDEQKQYPQKRTKIEEKIKTMTQPQAEEILQAAANLAKTSYVKLDGVLEKPLIDALFEKFPDLAEKYGKTSSEQSGIQPSEPSGEAAENAGKVEDFPQTRNWRKRFNNESDPFKKAAILRAVADVSTHEPELIDILEKAVGLPEESNIVRAVTVKKDFGSRLIDKARNLPYKNLNTLHQLGLKSKLPKPEFANAEEELNYLNSREPSLDEKVAKIEKREVGAKESDHIQTETDNNIETLPVSQRVTPEDLGDDVTLTRSQVAASARNEKPSQKTGFTPTQTDWFVGEMQKAYDTLDRDTLLYSNRLLEELRTDVAKTQDKRLQTARAITDYEAVIKKAKKPESKEEFRRKIAIHQDKLATLTSDEESLRARIKEEEAAKDAAAITIDIPGDGKFQFFSRHGIDRIHKKITGKTVEDFRAAKENADLFEKIPLAKGYSKVYKESELLREQGDALDADDIKQSLGTPTPAPEKAADFGLKKQSNGYFIFLRPEDKTKPGNFKLANASPLKIKGLEGYDLFYHKEKGETVITDAFTGTRMFTADTLPEAIKKLQALPPDQIDKAIKETLNKGIVSPRYKKMGEVAAAPKTSPTEAEPALPDENAETDFEAGDTVKTKDGRVFEIAEIKSDKADLYSLETGDTLKNVPLKSLTLTDSEGNLLKTGETESTTIAQPKPQSDQKIVTPAYAKAKGIVMSTDDIPEFVRYQYEKAPATQGDAILFKDKTPTGWYRDDISTGIMIFNPQDARFIKFESENQKSGSSRQMARTLAVLYAEENPIGRKPVEVSGEIVIKPIFEQEKSKPSGDTTEAEAGDTVKKSVPYSDDELKKIFKFKPEISIIKSLFSSDNKKHVERLISDFENRIKVVQANLAEGATFDEQRDKRWVEIAHEAVEAAKRRLQINQKSTSAGENRNDKPSNASASVEKIEDFGEKIGGARKDMWSTRGLEISDLEKMTDREKVAMVKKDQIWRKPDYQNIADAFNDFYNSKETVKKSEFAKFKDVLGAGDALLVKQIYDGMNQPPPDLTPEQWNDYVTAVRRVRDGLAEAIKEPSANWYEGLLNRLFPDVLSGSGWRAVWNRENENFKYIKLLGNRFVKAVQVNARDWAKAHEKAIKTGFPAKREAWQNRFSIYDGSQAQIYSHEMRGTKDGKYQAYIVHFVEINSRQFARSEDLSEARKALDSLKNKWIRVDTKGRTQPEFFDSQNEAIEAAKTAYAESRKKSEEPVRPQLESISRKGTDWRQGRDITAEEFQSAFGFRGGEFGNWNSQADRQQTLNHAYDALMDLSEVLGISPKAVSLNGELGIAFGARGSGGKRAALAHYEPSKIVINLTKMNGAGSLAHEWAHALDDYFGRQSGDKKLSKDSRSIYTSYGVSRDSKMRPEMIEAWKRVMDAITTREATAEETVEEAKARLEKTRKNALFQIKNAFYTVKDNPVYVAAFEKLQAAVQANAIGERLVTPNKKKYSEGDISFRVLEDFYAEMKDAMPAYFPKDNKRIIGSWFDNIRRDNEYLAKATAGEIQKKTPTLFKKESSKIDQARSKPYWSTLHEMFARSFESYVQDKIEEKGLSQYLVHGTRNNPINEFKPYPENTERENINAAFDGFFAAIEEENTDTGTMLKSVAQPSDADTAVEGFSSEAFERELESITLNRDENGKILAPNGKVSNIQNERLAKTIRTKAFKKWFGDWNVDAILPVDDIKHGESGLPGGKLELPSADEFIQNLADSSNELEPIEVYRDEDEYGEGGGWVVYDGSHRLEAAHRRGDATIKVKFLPHDDDAKEYIKNNPQFTANASKVVDENGEPMVVYHGTRSDFEVFDKNKLGSATTHPSARWGFVATPDRNYAGKSYAEGGGGNVLPLLLKVKNPYVISDVEYRELIPSGRNSSAKSAWDFIDELKSQNKVDGIILLDRKGEISEIFAFENTQIKSIFNRGSFSSEEDSILKSVAAPSDKASISDTGFYQNAEKAALELKQNAFGDAEQLRKQLLNGGAKQEELAWLDVDSLFDGKSKVTKQDVVDFVRANRIKVREVVKGASDWQGDELVVNGETVANLIENENGTWSFQSDYEEGSTEFDTREEAQREAEASTVGDIYGSSGTKFSQYTTPGGENYKELLLTLPPNNKPKDDGSVEIKFARQAPDGNRIYKVFRNGEFLKEFWAGETTTEQSVRRDVLIGLDINAVMNLEKDYKSPHWDEPNVLAHVRFDERFADIKLQAGDTITDSREPGNVGLVTETIRKGVRVLHIAEIQADGLQLLRELEAKLKEGKTLTAREQNDYDILSKFPFKKTEAWAGMAFRRMVRYAAENDFDAITWDTGEIQTERYDLSKQVNSIEVELTGTSNTGEETRTVDIEAKDGTQISFETDEKGFITEVSKGTTHQTNSWEGKHLSDVIGKDIAEKILAVDDFQKFEGLDLKTDSPGMRKFYDEIIVNYARKFIRKFNKDARVGTAEIDVSQNQGWTSTYNRDKAREAFDRGDKIRGQKQHDNEGKILTNRAEIDEYHLFTFKSQPQTVHSIAITPEMKESVLSEGVSLFRAEEETDEDFRAVKNVPTPQLISKASAEIIAGRVKGNLELGEILRRAKEELDIRSGKAQIGDPTPEASFSGAFYERKVTADTIRLLRETAKDGAITHPAESAKLNAIADTFAEAAKAKGGTAAFYMWDRRLPHEAFHQASYLGSLARNLLSRHAFFGKLQKHKAWQATADYLLKTAEYRAMKENSPAMFAATVTEETGAYIEGGERELLGISLKDAAEYMNLFYDSFVERNAERGENGKISQDAAARALSEFGDVQGEHQDIIGKIIEEYGKREEQSAETEKSGENAPSVSGESEQVAAGAAESDGRTSGIAGQKTGQKLRSLPETLRESGIAAEDEYYDAATDDETKRAAREILEKGGIESAIRQLKNIKEPSATDAQLGFLVAQTLEDAAAQATDAAEAESLRNIQSEVTSDLARKFTQAGQFISAARVVRNSPVSVVVSAQAILQEKSGDESAQLTPEQVQDFTDLGKESAAAHAELESLRRKLKNEQARIRRLKDAVEGKTRKRTAKSAKARESVVALVKQKHGAGVSAKLADLRAKLNPAQDIGLQKRIESNLLKRIEEADEPLDEKTINDLAEVGALFLTEGIAQTDDVYLPDYFAAAMKANFGNAVNAHLNEIYYAAMKQRDAWLKDVRFDRNKSRLQAKANNDQMREDMEADLERALPEELEDADVFDLLEIESAYRRKRNAVEKMHRLSSGAFKEKSSTELERTVTELAPDETAAAAAIVFAGGASGQEFYRRMKDIGIEGKQAKKLFVEARNLLTEAKAKIADNHAAQKEEVAENSKLIQSIADEEFKARRRADNAQREIADEFKRLTKSKFSRAAGTVYEGISNIPRNLNATGELSFMLKQAGRRIFGGLVRGAINSARQPSEFIPNIKYAADLLNVVPRILFNDVSWGDLKTDEGRRQLKSWTDETGFGRIMQTIENDPVFVESVKMNVSYSAAGKTGTGDKAGEEQLSAPMLEGLMPTRRFDQSMAGFLDMIRLESYKRMRENLIAQGLSPKKNRKEFEQIAKEVNRGTGRRNKFENAKRAEAFVSAIEKSGLAFAAGYTVSKYQMIGADISNLAGATKDLIVQQSLPKGARAEILKNAAAAYTGLALRMALLAAFAGATISFDPDDDDFLKFKLGDFRYDGTYGFQSELRAIFRLMKSVAHGNRVPFEIPYDVLTVGGRYLRNKLNVAPAFALNAILGKDSVGKDFSLTDWTRWVRLFAPITWASLVESGRKYGAAGVLGNLPEAIGAGVAIYPDRPEEATTEAEKLALKIKQMKKPFFQTTEYANKIDDQTWETVSQLKARARRGETVAAEVGKLKESGKINENVADDILSANGQTMLLEFVNDGRFSLSEVKAVWKAATDAEKETLRPMLEKRLRNKEKSDKLSAADQKIFDEMNVSDPSAVAAPEKVKAELDRLGIHTPDVGTSLSVKKGEKEKLTGEQYNNYRQATLSGSYQMIEKLINTDNFKRATDEQKEVMIRRVIAAQRKTAMEQTRRELRKSAQSK